jgi:hypothetical protein
MMAEEVFVLGELFQQIFKGTNMQGRLLAQTWN